MKKIVYAIALLAVGVPMIQSCIDDKVAPSVDNVRNGLAEKYEGEAYLKKAEADAKIILAEADASMTYADAQYRLAEAARIKAETELLAIQKQLGEVEVQLAWLDVQLKQIQVDSAKVALELQKVKLAEAYLDLQIKEQELRWTVAETDAKIQQLANEMRIKADSTELILKQIANKLLEEQLKELKKQNALDNENTEQMSKLLTDYNDAMVLYLNAVELLYQYKSSLSYLEFDTQNQQEQFITSVNLQQNIIAEKSAELVGWYAKLAKYEEYAQYTDLDELDDAIVDARIAEIEALEAYVAANSAYEESAKIFIEKNSNLTQGNNVTNTYYYQDGVSKFLNNPSFTNPAQITEGEPLEFPKSAQVAQLKQLDPQNGTYSYAWFALTTVPADAEPVSVVDGTQYFERDTLRMFTYTFTYNTLELPEPAAGVLNSLGNGTLGVVPSPVVPENFYVYATINDYYTYDETGVEYFINNYNENVSNFNTMLAQKEAAYEQALEDQATYNEEDAAAIRYTDYFTDDYNNTLYYQGSPIEYNVYNQASYNGYVAVKEAYEEAAAAFAPYEAQANALQEAYEKLADPGFEDLQDAYNAANSAYNQALTYYNSVNSLSTYWNNLVEEDGPGSLFDNQKNAQAALTAAQEDLKKALDKTPVDQAAINDAQAAVASAQAWVNSALKEYNNAQVKAQKWATLLKVATAQLNTARTNVNAAYDDLAAAAEDNVKYMAALEAYEEYIGYIFNGKGDANNGTSYTGLPAYAYYRLYADEYETQLYNEASAADFPDNIYDPDTFEGDTEGLIEYSDAGAAGQDWYYNDYIVAYTLEDLEAFEEAGPEALSPNYDLNQALTALEKYASTVDASNPNSLVAQYNEASLNKATDYVAMAAAKLVYEDASKSLEALDDIRTAFVNGDVITEKSETTNGEDVTSVLGDNAIYYYIKECQNNIQWLNIDIENAQDEIERLQANLDLYFSGLNNDNMNYDSYVEYLKIQIAAQEDIVKARQAQVDAAKAAMEAYKEKMNNSNTETED